MRWCAASSRTWRSPPAASAAVPPIVAARLAGARTLIHQQDVEPGLANRLLVPFAQRITVSLPSSLAHFPAQRAIVTGNPVRQEILAADPRMASSARLERDCRWSWSPAAGTARSASIGWSRPRRRRWSRRMQVVHLTGRGRGVPAATDSGRYRAVEFLVDEMPHLLAAATIVVSRAGMGTLTELAALGKPSLIVPMPGSHQWANAQAFARSGRDRGGRPAGADPEQPG